MPVRSRAATVSMCAILVAMRLFGPAQAQSLQNSVTETKAGIADMPMLVSGFAYVAGGAAMLSGAGMLKRHADNPQQNPLAPGVARMALGGIIAANPSFLDFVTDTLKKSADPNAQESYRVAVEELRRRTSGPIASIPPGTPRADPPGTLARLLGASEFIPEDGQYGAVPVIYFTNRNVERTRTIGNRDLPVFGTKNDNKLTIGQSIVTIPLGDKDRSGLARPFRISIGGYVIELGVEDVRRNVTLIDSKIRNQDWLVSAMNELKQIYAKVPRSSKPRFEGHALVFVHGYNVAFDDALMRAGQIAHDMLFDGPVFLYSWPSRQNEIAYRSDIDRAREGAVYLEELVQSVLASLGEDTVVHFISHSMGTEALFGALEKFAAKRPALGERRIGEVVTIAPDVTWTHYRQSVRSITNLVRGVTLFASPSDVALRASTGIAGGDCRAGLFCDGLPLIMDAVDTIDISQASSSWFSLGHSDALDRWPLLGDISKLLETGIRPPDVRHQALFQRITVAEQKMYWRYRK